MAKDTDMPIQKGKREDGVGESIMSSSILACISQWGTFLQSGECSLTKSMRNMVSARNTSTAAIRLGC